MGGGALPMGSMPMGGMGGMPMGGMGGMPMSMPGTLPSGNFAMPGTLPGAPANMQAKGGPKKNLTISIPNQQKTEDSLKEVSPSSMFALSDAAAQLSPGMGLSSKSSGGLAAGLDFPST